jgi:glycerol-3-phosphate dehydrogenase
MTKTILTDVTIIGGGINGLGIARELALRDISCVVIEKNDLVSGASSASSKLIHGGLRYLKEGHFRLVYESLKERYFLLKNAPHLVKPLPFLVPIYKDSPVKKWQFRLGLSLYDLLCTFHKIKPHRFFSPDEFSKLLPQIKQEGLVSGALYYDAQMDDARLGVEVAMDADRLGASILTYTEVTDIVQNDTNVTVTTRDHESQKQGIIQSHYVINATGPWSTLTAALAHSAPSPVTAPNVRPNVRLSKGVHIVVPKLTQNNALLLLAKTDNRVFFVLPWGSNYSLIGTTDTDYSGSPDQVSVTTDDINYLLNETAAIFPNSDLTAKDIIRSFAGLRPLPYDSKADSKASVGSISRQHQLKQDGRLFHLTGGKYTTFRSISESCCKILLSHLTPNTPFKSLTKTRPLIGACHSQAELFKQFSLWQSEYSFLTEPLFMRFVSLYGSEVYRIIKIMAESTEYQRCLGTSDYYIAEIVYFIRYAFVKTITDVIRRRTQLFFDPNCGQAYCTVIGHLIQQERQLSSAIISKQKTDALKLLKA